jgi:hypothetical protein
MVPLFGTMVPLVPGYLNYHPLVHVYQWDAQYVVSIFKNNGTGVHTNITLSQKRLEIQVPGTYAYHGTRVRTTVRTRWYIISKTTVPWVPMVPWYSS